MAAEQVDEQALQKKWGAILIGILIGLVLSLGFSFRDSLIAAYAMQRLDVDAVFRESEEGEGLQRSQRLIQKHFLNHDIYIPLEDIFFSTDSDENMNFLMRKACGSARLYIWVPFKAVLPVYGSRVWEKCWTLNPNNK